VNTDFAAALAESVGAERVVAGIDTKNGRIAGEGLEGAGCAHSRRSDSAALKCLRSAQFLVIAHVYTDGEGLMGGFPIDVAARLRKLTAEATDCRGRDSLAAGSRCAGRAGRGCGGGHGRL